MPDTYRLSIACNHEMTGHFQGWCDAITIAEADETSPPLDGAPGQARLSVERYDNPLVCQAIWGSLQLGALAIPYTRQVLGAPSPRWNAYDIAADSLPALLQFLDRGHWNLVSSTAAGWALWEGAMQDRR